MAKRNLNLGTDYVADSDEPIKSEQDCMTDEELNEEFDQSMSYFVRYPRFSQTSCCRGCPDEGTGCNACFHDD